MQPIFDTKMFYLGTLCKHGHNYKDSEKSLRRINGRGCLECARARGEKYEKEHKEQRNARSRIRSRKYYYDNKESVKASSRQYRRDNLGTIRDYKRKYRRANKDSVNAYFRAYSQIQKTNHTQVYVRQRLRRLVRRALICYSRTGKIWTSQQYGIDYNIIIAHLGPHPNTLGIKGDFHIDHIIPLSRFDLNDPEQIKLAFAPENLRWCPAKENWEKHAKIEGQLNLMTQKQLQAVL